MTSPATAVLADPDAVAAVRRGDLVGWATAVADRAPAGSPEGRFAEQALATCARISAALAAERTRLTAALDAAGVPVGTISAPSPQRHELDVGVADATTVRRALDVLAGVGYRPDHTWRRGAARSFWRTAGEVRATRSDDVTHVVRLRWRPPARGIRRRLDRLVRPSPPDWDAVELPAWAWWGYRAVRPVRLALERARRHPRDHAHLEPFLTTPRSLAPGLLAFAGVGPDDVLVDLGCGDGRLVIAAAATTGCRAIGVELDADLAATARAGVAGTALDDRVSVVAGDAADLPLDDVTVVTMFLPTAVLRRAVPDTLARLPAGARLLAHEQAGLPPGLAAPAATAVIVGDDGVTVAHRWDVPVTQPGGDGATPSTVTAR